MEKSKFLKFCRVLICLIATVSGTLLRSIIDGIDSWLNDHNDSYSPNKVIHLNPQYPYGSDSLGMPQIHHGQTKTNDIMILFDED